MAFVPFAMERWQSVYEHDVELNLSESGVHPLDLAELRELAGIDTAELDRVSLEYIRSNGTRPLRERIAAFHPGAEPSDIVVGNGSAEANFAATWALASAGGEFVFMEPNYFQIRGIAENLGVPVHRWWLREPDWEPDLDQLRELVTPAVRAIFITNPNNPTGRCFGADFIAGVVAIAESVGAWIVVDEVYRGAEFSGETTPTFWGAYDKVIVTGGLSKAYGLPGLRIGWAVVGSGRSADIWARKDYLTIAPSALNDYLATAALEPSVREALLARTRGMLRENWPVLREWLEARSDRFAWSEPEAGAIALPAFRHDVDTAEIAERLRSEESALIVPGAHFELPRHLRLGIGPPKEQLEEGLQRLGRVVDGVHALGVG